jgi:hypothetical protein
VPIDVPVAGEAFGGTSFAPESVDINAHIVAFAPVVNNTAAAIVAKRKLKIFMVLSSVESEG